MILLSQLIVKEDVKNIEVRRIKQITLPAGEPPDKTELFFIYALMLKV